MGCHRPLVYPAYVSCRLLPVSTFYAYPSRSSVPRGSLAFARPWWGSFESDNTNKQTQQTIFDNPLLECKGPCVVCFVLLFFWECENLILGDHSILNSTVFFKTQGWVGGTMFLTAWRFDPPHPSPSRREGKPRTQTDEGSLTPRFPEKSVSDLLSCFSRVSSSRHVHERSLRIFKRRIFLSLARKFKFWFFVPLLYFPPRTRFKAGLSRGEPVANKLRLTLVILLYLLRFTGGMPPSSCLPRVRVVSPPSCVHFLRVPFAVFCSPRLPRVCASLVGII